MFVVFLFLFILKVKAQLLNYVSPDLEANSFKLRSKLEKIDKSKLWVEKPS